MFSLTSRFLSSPRKKPTTKPLIHSLTCFLILLRTSDKLYLFFKLSLKISKESFQTTNPSPDHMAAQTSLPSSHKASTDSSAARLAKRALRHPPAVSETSLELPGTKEVKEYPRGWKLASITLALCCAVFVGTLVRAFNKRSMILSVQMLTLVK